MPKEQAAAFCQQLLAAGGKPARLGARDTLRLEAGMNLYGQDMDEGRFTVGRQHVLDHYLATGRSSVHRPRFPGTAA